MATREARAGIAFETTAIVASGKYTAPSGREVQIADDVQYAIHQSQLFVPSDLRSLRSRAAKTAERLSCNTSFEVKNETTFSAARRLVGRFGADRVAALNFASAKNPGGGFLGGSQAQEESLARASALVACLESQSGYYHANRQHASALYTDHMIVSPRVPVFRDDHDVLLEEPWHVTLITAPAPNATAIARNEPETLGSIDAAFRRRIDAVLSAAIVSGSTALVLGAWGCGVFGNDPRRVAELFGEFLLGSGPYARAFEVVAFAVLDRGTETIGPFAAQFSRSDYFEPKDPQPGRGQ